VITVASTNSKSNLTDDLISIDEVTVSPRGRKKNIDAALAEKLSNVPTDRAIALRATFGEVPVDERAKVSQIIRKHWHHVRTDQCRINYSPEGVPQVYVKR
jgi:hypothetical protein